MSTDTILRFIKRILPTKIFLLFQPAYHWLLAFIAMLIYRFPSRRLRLVAVTGTKGKSTTTELLNAILEEAGHTTAVSNTIRSKIADTTEPNMSKTSMRGRFFTRKFLSQALKAGCDTAVLEITSEGAKQFRHKWLALDALIFTNLSPEHIESHGSYENYREAKLSIARLLTRSSKHPRFLVVNKDDKEHGHFIAAAGKTVSTVQFSLEDAQPYNTSKDGTTFTFRGETFTSPLSAEFNLSNILAALTYAETLGTPIETMKQAVAHYRGTPGRVEHIHEGQAYDVVVDYAHTPDSLEKLYKTFAQQKDGTEQKLICVLGNTGGGRDTWKRSVMAKIADSHCTQIFLTNEDPYDENPEQIVYQMKEAIEHTPAEIIMDRRSAIHTALQAARTLSERSESKGNGAKHDVSVLITGKGTDPYIMEANGKRTPWSDARVTKEELKKMRSA